MKKHKIVVKFEGGTIREVRNVPEHYTVQMLDYDVEKYKPGELSEDECHKRCKIVEWRSEASEQGRAAGGRR
jgi:hypothetical protein